MRSLAPLTLLALLLLLAGCVAPAAQQAAPAAHAPTLGASAAPWTPTPTHEKGTLWLPTSGAQPARSDVRFLANASGEAVVLTLHLGSRLVVDTPRAITPNAMLELRAPDGAPLAKGMLEAPTAVDATLRATTNASGELDLVLLSHGGSDGTSMGDYVSYAIDASAP